MASESDIKEKSNSKPREIRMSIMAVSLISCGLHYVSLLVGFANDLTDIRFYFMSYVMALLKLLAMHSENLECKKVLMRLQCNLGIVHLLISICLNIGCATQFPCFHGILWWGYAFVVTVNTADVLICILQSRADPYSATHTKKDFLHSTTGSDENSISGKASGFLLGGSRPRKRTVQ
ncbi:hypothetical protein ACHQM5_019742 [Ranunculus cassubicifolius]